MPLERSAAACDLKIIIVVVVDIIYGRDISFIIEFDTIESHDMRQSVWAYESESAVILKGVFYELVERFLAEAPERVGYLHSLENLRKIASEGIVVESVV